MNFDLIQYPMEHFSERGAPVCMLVLHSIGVPLEGVFDGLRKYEVSAHYFVPQVSAGQLQQLMPDYFGHLVLSFPDKIPVVQMVQDDKRAWHAGVSTFGAFNSLPGCKKGLNSCSIGIEFHAPGYMDGGDMYRFTPFTLEQAETGIALIEHLLRVHDIPPQNILGHSTIAVGRKTDPGPLFFWDELRQRGIGYWPDDNLRVQYSQEDLGPDSSIVLIQRKLVEIGFTECPQDGLLASVQPYIDAYTMQFESHLWGKEYTEVYHDLLASLESFKCQVIMP